MKADDMSTELYKYIGSKLKAIRKEKGILLKDIAIKLNRSRHYVIDAEYGRFRMTIDKLYEYCAVLDIRLKDLLPDFIPGSSTESFNKIREQNRGSK